MKANIVCKITSVTNDFNYNGEKVVKIAIQATKGNTIAEDGKLLKCDFEGTLMVKPVAVEKLILGASLVLSVETE